MLLNLQTSTILAQGTAFNYQGWLNNNGGPASGLYDVRFMVWDASTNGNLIAGPLTNSATGVTNGLFTVTLDFGSGVFTGPSRWLELDVRTNGNGAFTSLIPRQPITPTPYAIYSATAGTAATAIAAVTAATAGSANSVSATNIVGTVPAAATATNAPNGTPLNSMVSSLPFCILHNNLTATIYTNGMGSNPTLFSFPSSQSAGWNEIQAMFVQSTNASHVGFRLMIDPGLYQFTTQLMVTNSCIIEGAGEAATIFEYVGATNNYSLYNMTNNQGSTSPYFAEQAVALIWVPAVSSTKLVGDEPNVDYNVTLKNFSLKISTNMYCVGILDGGGDNGSIENVIVGGPQLWSYPSYFNGWLDNAHIPEPSKMVGFVIGDNQQLILHCRAVGCADGISFSGNSFSELDDFNAIACGIDWNGSGESAFPADSDYSVNAGVMIPRNSSIAGLNINNLLTYENWLSVWVGSEVSVNINIWNDQGSEYPDIGLLKSANPLVSVTGLNAANTLAYTNINGGISLAAGVNASISDFVTLGSSFYYWNGYEPIFGGGNSETGNAFQVYVPFNANIQLAPGYNIAGNGSGLTNIPASAITGGFNTNIIVGGHVFYITNGVIMNVQ